MDAGLLQALGDDICGLSHRLSQPSFHLIEEKWRLRKAKARALEVCVWQGQLAGAAAKGCFPPLCRCFRAWQRLVQRGAQYREYLAHRRLRTLRVCLAQWMEMKQLRASDVTGVTRLAEGR